jgi:hypothetical protein
MSTDASSAGTCRPAVAAGAAPRLGSPAGSVESVVQHRRVGDPDDRPFR